MIKNVLLWVLILLLAWNGVVFAVYGADKSFAQNSKRRVPEQTLISMAFGMGAPGALLGMVAFRHKTRKPIFIVLVVAALLVNILLAYGGYRLWRSIK